MLKSFGMKTAAFGAVLCTALTATYLVARDGTPESQVLSAVYNNLASVGTVTGTISCTSTDNSLSFTNGGYAAKGVNSVWIARSASSFAISNDAAYNVTTTDANDPSGFRWDDTSGRQLSCWVNSVGYSDPRTALGDASNATDLTLDPTPELVNGVNCYKLAGTGVRIWVDAGSVWRVLRYETDDSHTGVLVSRADYGGWAQVAGGEVPTQLSLSNYYADTGNLIKTSVFNLTGVQGQATVNDALFNVWVPGDSGGGGIVINP